MTANQETPEMQSIEWKGGKYTGQLKEEIPHGRGRFVLPDGTRYEGEWKEGLPHGRGKLIYASGDSYKGELLKGKRHGYGINILTDGEKRSGLWENGKLVRAMALEEIKREMRERTAPGKDKQDKKASQLEPAINVQSLSHRYGSLQAVKNISFSVRPGEILGFLGPNGAGKSTTIKVLTGQLALQKGSAQILGT